jgi:signal peptidase I
MKNHLGNILFYGLCGLLLFFVLSQFGILPFRITYFLTGSMSPTYLPGDLAVLYTGKNIDARPGDVVLFTVDGNPVIHRVKSIENGQITTQGDANQAADPGKITHVDGKLLFSIPKLGYVIDYFHILIQSIAGIITPKS